jgi:hypothetical protein
MKTLLLAGVAALSVLYASTPSAEGWEVDCRRGRIFKLLPKPDDTSPGGFYVSVERDDMFVSIDRDQFDELAKAIANARRECKEYDRFMQCVVDREAGKVKHCYENDRRWRSLFQKSKPRGP